jgi:hypothetical protein
MFSFLHIRESSYGKIDWSEMHGLGVNLTNFAERLSLQNKLLAGSAKIAA